MLLSFLLTPALLSPSPLPFDPEVLQRGPARLLLQDVDGDGCMDALALRADGSVRLLANLGDRGHRDVTLAAGLGDVEFATCAVLEDLDADGAPDLFLGSWTERVWRNRGDGTFEPFRPGIDHGAVDLACSAVDADGDGLVDLHVTTDRGDALYRNLGAGHFSAVDLPGVEWSAAGAVAPEPENAASRPEGEAAGAPRTAAARRRLARWCTLVGAGTVTIGAPSASAASGFAATPTANAAPAAGVGICANTIVDQGTGLCIEANSTPALGKLYPISTRFNVAANGNVGLGTTAPIKNLDTRGTNEPGIFIEGVDPNITLQNTTGNAQYQFLNRGGSLLVRGNGGAERLTIRADGTVSVKETLEVRGGADIVERFDAGEDVEPGRVLVIDPETPGRLRPSGEAYDTRAAGAVIGKAMGSLAEGEGLVLVLVNLQ